MPAKITWKLFSCGGLLLLAGAGLAEAQLAPAGATPRPLLLPSIRPGATPGATPAPLGLQPSRPLGTAMQGPASNNPAPPREVPLVEKKFEQLSNQQISKPGQQALEINPAKWKHAETDNFIIHYRRATEAQKIVREVDYDLWFVATTLGATRDRYSKKSHVYVFEDHDEWKKFLDVSDNPMKWAASFARGDELFLNVRGGGNSGQGTSFDSHTLAHETTHAVVARLYQRRRWPIWLSEGFAEYMGGASVAARKGQRVQHYERDLKSGDMPLKTLATMKGYPSSQQEIHALYQSSEKFVRFLMTEGGKDRIAKFIEAILGGQEMESAVLGVYGDKFKDWASFEKKYEKFSK
jgi:hypothetical protein